MQQLLQQLLILRIEKQPKGIIVMRVIQCRNIYANNNAYSTEFNISNCYISEVYVQ